MSKSSKNSLNTDETICLPPETFYSCNVEEDFDNETYFVKSKSVKTNDNKKETYIVNRLFQLYNHIMLYKLFSGILFLYWSAIIFI